MNGSDDVLNAQEAADFLGGHVETIRRLARKGEIPAYKVGKDWRFRRSALLVWINEHPKQQKSPCILVVEDNENDAILVKILLDANGFYVLLAADGRSGLEVLHDEHVDLVLLDLRMPVMNGPEFLCELRNWNEDLPVIIHTGYPDGDLIKAAMRYGPFTLLAKSVPGTALLQAVHSAIKGSNTTSDRKVSGPAIREEQR